MDVKTAIDTRRAYRALMPFEVSSDLIGQLGEAAGLAPSCFNKQPWRFVFIHDQKSLNEFHSVFPENNAWAFNASLIIAVLSEASLDCRMKDGRDYYLFDTGIAGGFIMLRAAELGLVAHPMAGYNQEAAKKLLNIPDDLTLINIIAVGKHAENYEEIMPKEKIDSEKNRPARKPLSEFIHVNRYGNPY